MPLLYSLSRLSRRGPAAPPCADAPPIVSNGCCQDLRPFQPLSCRHGIVDPVISPKQNGFLEDEGGHLPDFSIGTRTEPLPEGTRRGLSRGGAGGTDAEIGMQKPRSPLSACFAHSRGSTACAFAIAGETCSKSCTARHLAASFGLRQISSYSAATIRQTVSTTMIRARSSSTQGASDVPGRRVMNGTRSSLRTRCIMKSLR